MRTLVLLALCATALALPPSSVPHDKLRWRPATEPIKSSNFVSKALSPKEVLGVHKREGISYPKQDRRPVPKQQEQCSVENPCPPAADGRVVGGEEACDGQFPWLTVVECASSNGDIISGGGPGRGWLCTGSLIFEDWVLTAGHCVHGCVEFNIYAGVYSRDAVGTAGDDTLVITVPSTGLDFEAPDYVPIGGLESLNDIGLIPLNENVDLSRPDISLSCLPSRDVENELFEGEFTTVTGWGVTLDSNGGAADVPNFYHDLPVINNDVCDDNLLTLGVNDEMLCIDSSGPHGVCNGDSGGPLNLQPAQGDYSSYVQIGIASFVANDGCDTERPNVFARVTSFLDLIAERTGYDV